MWTTILIIGLVLAGLAGYLVLTWKRPGLGIALLPLSAGGLIVVGAILLESNGRLPHGPVLLLAGLLLFLATVLLVHFKVQSDLDEEPWYKVVSQVLFFIFKYLLYLALLTLVFQGFGPILFILLLIFTFRFKQTRRYSLALNVLSTLSAAIRQNLPLPMALETAATGRKDPASRIFRQIAKGLCEGLSLSEALARGYRKCPAEILATIRAGEAMHQLPQAIAALEADSIASINDFEKVRPIHPAYPLLVGTIVISIIIGLSVFIIPTFVEVVSDITGGRETLPAATQALVAIARFFSRVEVYVPVSIVLLGGVIFSFYATNRPRRPQRLGLLSRLNDRIKWSLPGVHYFERLRAQHRTVQCLRVGLNGGHSFDAVVGQTLRLDVNDCFRANLRRWLRRIEAGEPIADSAAACGLGHSLAWALDEKVNKGNTPGLLEMLEEIYRNRYHYRLNILHSVMWPFVVVGMGCGVGFVVYAMFSAIVAMIVHTMNYTMP